MQAQSAQLSFEIHHNGQYVRSEVFSQESVTIGRAENSNLRLEGEGVADLHAVIKMGPDGKLRITDPGDAGISLDGEQVEVRAVLPSRAEIGIGEYTLRFELRQAAPASAGAPAAAPAARAEAEAPQLSLAEQSEAALTGDVLERLGNAWRAGDDLKVDDVRVKKILEVREVWGDLMLDVQYFNNQKPAVFLGEGHKPRTDFFMPRERLPVDNFPFLQRKGDGWYLRFTGQFRGFIEVAEVQIPLQDLVRQGDATAVNGLPDTYEVRLTDEHRFVVALGPDILCGNFVHPSKAVPQSMEVDIPFVGLFALLFLICGVSIVLLSRLPPPPEPELSELPDRFVQLLKKQEPQEKPKVETKVIEKKEDPQPEGAKAKEDEGKVGKKDEKLEKAKGSKVALDKAKLDKKIAENAGLLGALDKQDDMASIFGGGGLNTSISNAVGGLQGNIIGSQGGSGGRGTRGFGPGGGGTSAGIGGVGTKGGGPGGGGYGGDEGYKAKKKQANIDMGGSEAIVLGAIDPSLIDKAIRENQTQIRYCYSRELNKNPKLFGKVVIKFTIGPEGSVVSSSVKESTIDSVTVGTCVADRINRIQFPQPKGGGKVIVTYPFNFNAAG